VETRTRVVVKVESRIEVVRIGNIELGHLFFYIRKQPCLEPTEETEFPLLIPHQEYILTFLVPALIIIAMLLFAILIACLLHRSHIPFFQCCGSGIRCLFDPWIRDPGWVKTKSGADHISESLEIIFLG
jgi:hypothetical protein